MECWLCWSAPQFQGCGIPDSRDGGGDLGFSGHVAGIYCYDPGDSTDGDPVSLGSGKSGYIEKKDHQ